MERKQSSHIEKVILFFFIKFTTVELISPRTQRTYFKHSNASINRNLNLSKKIEKKNNKKRKKDKTSLFVSFFVVGGGVVCFPRTNQQLNRMNIVNK